MHFEACIGKGTYLQESRRRGTFAGLDVCSCSGGDEYAHAEASAACCKAESTKSPAVASMRASVVPVGAKCHSACTVGTMGRSSTSTGANGVE